MSFYTSDKDYEDKLQRILKENQHILNDENDLYNFENSENSVQLKDQDEDARNIYETTGIYGNINNDKIDIQNTGQTGKQSGISQNNQLIKLQPMDQLTEFSDSQLNIGLNRTPNKRSNVNTLLKFKKRAFRSERKTDRRNKFLSRIYKSTKKTYSDKKHCLPRTFNSSISRRNVVKSMIHENKEDTGLSVDRLNTSKLSVYRDHLNIHYNTMGNYMEQIRDQNTEIHTLSKTIKEMKSRSMSLPQQSPSKKGNPYYPILQPEKNKDKFYIPLPVSEREKFSFLQKKVIKLENENSDLRQRNKWLIARMKSQSEALKSGLNKKALSIRKKSVQSVQDGISNELTQQYYTLNDKLEKIKVSAFKNIREPNFLDCVNLMLRDVTSILDFQQFSLNLKYGENTGLDKVIKQSQIPKMNNSQNSKQNFISKYKIVMIQRQGPKGLKIGSELDSRVKAIVLRNLDDFREIKTEKGHVLLPIKIHQKGFKAQKNIGVIVFKLGTISKLGNKRTSSKLNCFKKLALYELLGYISMIYEMYSVKRRAFMMENIFQTFADKMPFYMSSEVVSQLLIRLKINISKIVKAEDFTVLVSNQKDNNLYGLNPSYSVRDLDPSGSMELNRFSSQIGLTSKVYKSKEYFWSDSPHTLGDYVPQIDNLSPVFSIKNLLILPISTERQPNLGIIQVINNANELDHLDFIDICKKIAAVIGYLIEMCDDGIKNNNIVKQVDDGVEIMRMILKGEQLIYFYCKLLIEN